MLDEGKMLRDYEEGERIAARGEAILRRMTPQERRWVRMISYALWMPATTLLADFAAISYNPRLGNHD